jgi:hypothetical protein
METESGEEMFERLCGSLGLRWSRIKEASDEGERRPDYTIVGTDGSVLVAEVKTVTPTAEETREIQRTLRGEIFARGGKPGERLRRMIGKANEQLKVIAAGNAGILVVFNPDLFLRWHTEPYAVLTAMRGLDVVDVHVPRDPSQSPTFGPTRSGPGKRMTENANTSTSAIVCPVEIQAGEWQASVFHNRYAAKRLTVPSLDLPGFHHWEIAADERDWAPLPRAI